MKKICLHLGCGKRRINDFINIDIQKLDSVDIICDISKLPYDNDSIDLIYSCSNIEHFGRWEWKEVLKHWFSLLKKGGKLQLSTMDFDSCIKEYKKNKNIDSLLGFIVGGQKDNFDKHGIIFSFQYLKKALEEIGFKNIKRVHWKKFEPYKNDKNYDDYARSYIPHMDFDSGRLMMLNIEAIKE